jgi:hypothetical protein
MGRKKWNDISSTASPESLARAERKTEALLSSITELPERATSPLAVGSLDLDITRDEIVAFVREGRDGQQ